MHSIADKGVTVEKPVVSRTTTTTVDTFLLIKPSPSAAPALLSVISLYRVEWLSSAGAGGRAMAASGPALLCCR